MKVIFFMLSLIATLPAMSGGPDFKSQEASSVKEYPPPAKITIRGTCTSVTTQFNEQTQQTEHEVTCETSDAVCATFENGNFSTSGCDEGNVSLTNVTWYEVNDVAIGVVISVHGTEVP